MDPLLKVMKIEDVRIGNLFFVQPFEEEREVLSNLFSVKYAVHHMAAEKPELYLVPSMSMNFFVFVNALEDMRGS